MNPPNSAPRIEVYASGSWIGFHCWPDAPDFAAFLRAEHRHKFCWTIWWVVSHDDREIEFCTKQQEVSEAIEVKVREGETMTWSCERWALFLLELFDAVRVEVSEDMENGAVVSR